MSKGFACLRFAAAAAAFLIVSVNQGIAQSADPKASAQQKAAGEGENQKKVDEFAEAARLLGGPAANPECVWLGRRVVSLLWRDDLDTAFRHLELYDRFGCPSGHIQATFRCVVRQGDPKAPETLPARIHSCWINPNVEVNTATPSASVNGPTTSR